MMPFLRTILIVSVLFCSPVFVEAGSVQLNGNAELRLGVGILSGVSDELVYDADGSGSGRIGYKISELNWQLNQVPMAGIGVTFSAGESLLINGDYWANVVDGNGTMDDYDWIYIGLDWSHWSHHPDTTVRKAELIDINGEYVFVRESRRGEKSSWSGVLGYRRDFFDWQAKGGYGIYSTIPTDYRDQYLIFPDVPGISYQQTFTTPYIGLRYRSNNRSRKSRTETRFGMYYSAWAHGEDVDIHHLRDLRFEEQGAGGQWYKFELEMDFEVSRSTMFTVGYSSQTYSEIKSSSTATDLTTDISTFYPGDSAGLSHKSELIKLGMNYRF